MAAKSSPLCKLSFRFNGELARCEVCCDGAVVLHSIKVKKSRSKGPVVISVVPGTFTIATFPGLRLTVLGGAGEVVWKRKSFPVKPGAPDINLPPNSVFTFKLSQPAQFLAKRIVGPEMAGDDEEQCMLE